MTDKPEIKVGQKWVTRDCGEVLIVSTSASGRMPIVAEWGDVLYRCYPNGRAHSLHEDDRDLIALAPATVKRTVVLYRGVNKHVTARDEGEVWVNAVRISEPLEIEFTLLPGESAE